MNNNMNNSDLPLSLSLAITLRTIERAFRKSIREPNADLPPESFEILIITCFQDNVIQQDLPKWQTRINQPF
jgi:hypothetical protein